MNLECLLAVSYTHLDVYKRQPLHGVIRVELAKITLTASTVMFTTMAITYRNFITANS